MSLHHQEGYIFVCTGLINFPKSFRQVLVLFFVKVRHKTRSTVCIFTLVVFSISYDVFIAGIPVLNCLNFGIDLGWVRMQIQDLFFTFHLWSVLAVMCSLECF